MGGEQSFFSDNDNLYIDEGGGEVEMMEVTVPGAMPGAAPPPTGAKGAAGLVPSSSELHLEEIKPLPPPPAYDAQEFDKDADEGRSAASPPMSRDEDDGTTAKM